VRDSARFARSGSAELSSRRANKRYLVWIGGRRFFRRLLRSPVRCRFRRPTRRARVHFLALLFPRGAAFAPRLRVCTHAVAESSRAYWAGEPAGGWLEFASLVAAFPFLAFPAILLVFGRPALANERPGLFDVASPVRATKRAADTRYVGSVCGSTKAPSPFTGVRVFTAPSVRLFTPESDTRLLGRHTPGFLRYSIIFRRPSRKARFPLNLCVGCLRRRERTRKRAPLPRKEFSLLFDTSEKALETYRAEIGLDLRHSTPLSGVVRCAAVLP
jgi:hypothetical protein